MQRKLKFAAPFAAAIILAVVLVACNGSSGATAPGSNGGQKTGQQVTSQIAGKALTAEPYPTNQMNDFAERANLTQRLLRLNDPNKVGYFYGLNNVGQVMFYTPIKGKVSSMGSQLTNTQQIVPCARNNDNACVVESMGDDGSYGPEECATQGVFGFTPAGVMFEWCDPWTYSDAPLHLTTQPLMTYDPAAAPSSTAPTAPAAPSATPSGK